MPSEIKSVNDKATFIMEKLSYDQKFDSTHISVFDPRGSAEYTQLPWW